MEYKINIHYCNQGQWIPSKALLDTGAQKSYIKKSLGKNMEPQELMESYQYKTSQEILLV